MKVFCLVALCITVCWPAKDLDVSGGDPEPNPGPAQQNKCHGHYGELKCTALNGETGCKDKGNVFTAGFSDNGTAVVNPTVGVNSTYYCHVLGGSSDCSGSAQKPIANCILDVKVKMPLPL